MTDRLFDVRDRVVMVAGGAGGLGGVLARAFAERGARIALADIDGTRARKIAETLGAADGDGLGCALDVRKQTSCAGAVRRVVKRFGRLDVLINAVGIFSTAAAVELDRRAWDATIATNLSGAFLIAQAAGRIMVKKKSGRIITIASASSRVANPGYAAYAAAKAGVSQLTRVLALEWAPFGVTVNAIGPAMTPTPLTRELLADGERHAAALARIPLGRFGTPEDLIGVALLLASDAGAFITGQTIFVDGGRTLV